MIHSLSAYRRAFATALALLILSVPAATSPAQTSPAFVKALEKGDALMEKGRYQAAIRALEKAEELSIEPSVLVLLDLAICFNRIGEFEKSGSYARDALETAEDPVHRASALNLLGLSLLSRDDLSSAKLLEAEAAFRKVLEITDGQANMARYNLGEVLKRQSRFQEAHAAFAEYLERQPDGQRSAQARSEMDLLACLQPVRESEARSNDDSETFSEGEPTGPIRVGGDVKAPVKCFAPNPRYPLLARSGRIQRVVILEAIIDKNGNVTNVVKILNSFDQVMDRAAVDAVSRWKFRPATLNGKPVAVIYNLTVNFRLQ